MIQKLKNNPFIFNSFILFGGSMLANALNYFFHLIVGRLVSVEIYGEIESLTSLINIISVPAMTLTFIATRYASHSKATQNPLESRLIFLYLTKKVLRYGLPFFVLALVLTPLVSGFLKIESYWPLVLIWILMFLSFFSSVNSGIINGWQKFKSSSLIGIWSALIKLLGAFLLIKLGFELSGAIGGFLLGALASYIASFWAIKFIFRRKNLTEEKEGLIDLKSIRKYALPVLWGTLALNVLGNADMFLAKHNLDQITAGNYGALTIVSKIIFFATGVAATVLFSMSSEKNHRKESSLKTFRLASLAIFLISGSASIIYYFFPELVLGLLFGEKYLSATPYLFWFAILVSLYSFVNLLIQYLLSVQKTAPMYSMLAISLLMALALMFWGKSIYAILEIAILSQILAVFIGLFHLREKHA